MDIKKAKMRERKRICESDGKDRFEKKSSFEEDELASLDCIF